LRKTTAAPTIAGAAGKNSSESKQVLPILP